MRVFEIRNRRNHILSKRNPKAVVRKEIPDYKMATFAANVGIIFVSVPESEFANSVMRILLRKFSNENELRISKALKAMMKSLKKPDVPPVWKKP